MKEVRAVQMFLPHPSLFARLRRTAFAAPLLLAAGPAHAVTFESALEDARDIAADTGAGLAAFAQRIVSGDMMAIQGAMFGASALFGFVGLWLLLRRPEADETELDFLVRKRTHAQPVSAESRLPETAARFEPGADRPPRLLEAVAAARAQYEISVAERQGAK